MTKYEYLSKKIEALKEIGLRCADRGSYFTEVWFGKAYELGLIRDGLTVEDAGRQV